MSKGYCIQNAARRIARDMHAGVAMAAEETLMKEFDQSTIAHLQMIQQVIARMAGNSFSLRTLAVTISTGIIALLGSIPKPTPIYALSALLPLFVFWFLDARFLQLERLYRRLYDNVRLNKTNEPFTMVIGPYFRQEKSVLTIALSWSVLWVYATLLVLLALIGVGLKFNV